MLYLHHTVFHKCHTGIYGDWISWSNYSIVTARKAKKSIEREAAEKEEKIDMDSKVQKKDEYLVSAFNQSQNSDENQKLIKIIQGGMIGGTIIFEVMRSVKKIKKSSKKKK